MTDDYSQPDFYRFNQDSLQLVNWILQRNESVESILDFGAGSGIIGIELARVLKPKKLTLVEIQDSYFSHLNANTSKYLSHETIIDIQIKSFAEFESAKFELIVCNPPYYLPGKGELPQNPERAIARSFIKDSWEILLSKIAECLAGECFIILKADDALFDHIQKQTKLTVKRHDLGQTMILELF